MDLVKKQLLPHQPFLRRLSTKTRVQVSEQVYYLTFACGGFLYISQLLDYKQKTEYFANGYTPCAL